MLWTQRTIDLPPMTRGCHLVTREVLEGMPEIAQVEVGLLHVFVQHTSASLTLNENADPDVLVDLESSLNALAPEDIPYEHTIEGRDDMPAHVKSSLTDSGLTIPIRAGRPALGTWQGIYFCEHRNHGGHRRLVVTLFGQPQAE